MSEYYIIMGKLTPLMSTIDQRYNQWRGGSVLEDISERKEIAGENNCQTWG